jgi:UMF1 family MFS transporter
MASQTASRREVFGWCMYDFANSGYTTTILAAIFNVYFVSEVAAVVTSPDGSTKGVLIGDRFVPASSFFAFTVSVSMLLVAVSAPALGAIADYTAAKKRFLAVFLVFGASFTGLLTLVGPGDYWMGAALLIVSNVGFAGSLPFYNSFLPEIAADKDVGKISGYGWGLGYLGGGALLFINLMMLRNPAWFGLDGKESALKFCIVSVAVWWVLFSIPTMLWVRERGVGRPLPPGAHYLTFGFKQAWRTLLGIRRYRELTKLLIGFLIYNDAIETVILMATIFGKEVLDMPAQQLVLFLLMVQGAALVGSIVSAFLCDKFGNRRVIIGTLTVWTACVFWAYGLGIVWDRVTEYWIMGVVAGLVLGGSQSASRALQAQFMPAARSAEFFGFFALSGKFASVTGPLLYGGLIMLTGSVRTGILSLAVLFVIGLIIVLLISEERGLAEREQ